MLKQMNAEVEVQKPRTSKTRRKQTRSPFNSMNSFLTAVDKAAKIIENKS